jgi:hypothetical protein
LAEEGFLNLMLALVIREALTEPEFLWKRIFVAQHARPIPTPSHNRAQHHKWNPTPLCPSTQNKRGLHVDVSGPLGITRSILDFSGDVANGIHGIQSVQLRLKFPRARKIGLNSLCLKLRPNTTQAK